VVQEEGVLHVSYLPVVLNFHKLNRSNTGDMSCPVANYFELPLPVVKADLCEVKRTDLNVACSIVGGGGLFYFKNSLQYLCEHKQSPVIGWGLGANDHDVTRPAYPDWISGFDLLAVRDWGTGLRWVPCPSCMSPLFDAPNPPQQEIVVLEHQDRPILLPFPRIDNTCPMEELVQFLASGETVITNSYHGMYWASLLGRKVVVFPFSSRFYGMRHPVTLCDPAHWAAAVRSATGCTEALEECREANREFHAEVSGFIATRCCL
jgi:hypothetical protein